MFGQLSEQEQKKIEEKLPDILTAKPRLRSVIFSGTADIGDFIADCPESWWETNREIYRNETAEIGLV